MSSAREITSDIKWILSDAGLDHAPGFRVTTKDKGDRFVSTVLGCNADRAEAALAERARNTGATFERSAAGVPQ